MFRLSLGSGILTIGYSMANMNPVLDASKIKYLVTDAMMQMPLIADWVSQMVALMDGPWHLDFG